MLGRLHAGPDKCNVLNDDVEASQVEISGELVLLRYIWRLWEAQEQGSGLGNCMHDTTKDSN